MKVNTNVALDVRLTKLRNSLVGGKMDAPGSLKHFKLMAKGEVL